MICVCVCVYVSGGVAGNEQEADDHQLPAQEVRAKQETPGDHQQEAAGLCTGNTRISSVLNVHKICFILLSKVKKSWSLLFLSLAADELKDVHVLETIRHSALTSNEHLLFNGASLPPSD